VSGEKRTLPIEVAACARAPVWPGALEWDQTRGSRVEDIKSRIPQSWYNTQMGSWPRMNGALPGN
jgi:hypothetical protein